MLISGGEGSCASLKASLPKALSGRGMTMSIRPTVLPTHGAGIPYVVESLSLDTPGIVRVVTSVLLAQSINIESLECTVAAAPLSGSPMFKMRVAVNISPGTKLAALKAELSKAAEAHDLDISVRPLRSMDRDLE
ncbi:MAG: hypothetical protein NT061_07430 [Spirochaetes bacterium]|nr:hypothetical protein [Spirochaetota bacterium]